MKIDAVIFGGGVAGLWLLDELVRRNRTALLLEAYELGSGQTVASQGIIHGGLKYSLKGKLTSSAKNISEMPLVWKNCLQGKQNPDLSSVKVRADHCHLWRTDSLRSKLGMVGARLGLRVPPEVITRDQRPEVLEHCPGEVARLNEQVISPESLVSSLFEKHRSRILKIDPDKGVTWETGAAGEVKKIVLHNTDNKPKRGWPRLDRREAPVLQSPGFRDAPTPATPRKSPVFRQSLKLEPGCVIFTAGAGNAHLREQVGLSSEKMQRRPLHMAMARGNLPTLNGHCVDGMKTRITITTDTDSEGRIVWQIGGQLAETGVAMDVAELIELAQKELQATLPGIDLGSVEWATYRVDRAEGAAGTTGAGLRPETVQILQEGNTITAWPTKLVLAPVLAEEICKLIETDSTLTSDSNIVEVFKNWPRPEVAQPPWETCSQWYSTDNLNANQQNSAGKKFLIRII